VFRHNDIQVQNMQFSEKREKTAQKNGHFIDMLDFFSTLRFSLP